MTVFVDTMEAEFRGMTMCHCWSDTSLQELHDMMVKIGMRREWFQCRWFEHGKEHVAEAKDIWPLPHYDLSKTKRAKAIALGAVSIGYGAFPEWFNAVAMGCFLHPQRQQWLKKFKPWRKRRKKHGVTS